MERKNGRGFRCIFTVAFERFLLVRLGDCHAGLEPPAGARNRRKATVKIRRNLQLRFLHMNQLIYKIVYLDFLNTRKFMFMSC